jgi:hypothetical protein
MTTGRPSAPKRRCLIVPSSLSCQTTTKLLSARDADARGDLIVLGRCVRERRVA